MVRTFTYLLFILLVVFGNSLNAQNSPKADSIQLELSKESESVKKSLLSLEYAWEIKYSNLNKAFKISNNSLQILKTHGHEEGIAIAHSYLGVFYFLENDLAHAVSQLKKAEKLLVEQKNYKRLSRVYNNLGIVCSSLYDYDAALVYYNKSLEIKQHQLNETDLSANLINIGTIYYDQGRYEECIRSNEEALILTLKEHRDESTATIYSNLGAAHERLGHYKRSINYALKALDLYQNVLDNPLAHSRTYSNLGTVYMSQDLYQEAEYYFNKALEINKTIENEKQHLVALNNLAELFRKQNKLDKAESFIQKAINYNSQNSVLEEQLISLETASNIAVDKKDFEFGLKYYKEYIYLSDSLLSLSNYQNTQLTLIQSELAIEKVKEEKELEAKKVTQQKLNIRAYFGWIAILIMVCTVLIFVLKVKVPSWVITLLNFFFSLAWISYTFLYLFVESGYIKIWGTKVFFLVILGVVILGAIIHTVLQTTLIKKLKSYE